ncbi:MAG: hypothetical protein V3T17_15575 [Pseudomonadales bacterium]
MTHKSEVDVVIPENVKAYVKLQANNDFHIYRTPPYFSSVENFVSELSPKYCLELGAGVGRMSVYFFKRFIWKDTFFYLQDGDSGTIQYGGIRQSNQGEYYNSFSATEEFCQSNGLDKIRVLSDFGGIKDKIDFCYSFAAIGFHWHINLYLDRLVSNLVDNAKLLFEVRAPLEKGGSANESKRREYQIFFDDQVSYANNHPQYDVIDVVDLKNYDGYFYRDKTYFLILNYRLRNHQKHIPKR